MIYVGEYTIHGSYGHGVLVRKDVWSTFRHDEWWYPSISWVPGLNSVPFLHRGNAQHTGEFLPICHRRSHRPQPVSPKEWKWNMGYLKGIQYKVYYYWRYNQFWMNHDSRSFRVSYIRCSLITCQDSKNNEPLHELRSTCFSGFWIINGVIALLNGLKINR